MRLISLACLGIGSFLGIDRVTFVVPLPLFVGGAIFYVAQGVLLVAQLRAAIVAVVAVAALASLFQAGLAELVARLPANLPVGLAVLRHEAGADVVLLPVQPSVAPLAVWELAAPGCFPLL